MRFGASHNPEDLALTVDFVKGLLAEKDIEGESSKKEEQSEENRVGAVWMPRNRFETFAAPVHRLLG